MDMLLDFAIVNTIKWLNELKPRFQKFMFKSGLITTVVLMISSHVSFSSAAEGGEFLLGINHFENSEYNEAYSLFVKLEPELESNAEFHYYYGLALLKTDNAKQAVAEIEVAIELRPNNADYHFALARVYETRQSEISFFRMPALARAYKASLRRTIELDPEHTAALQTLTSVLLSFPSILGGNAEEGEIFLSRLRELDEAAAYMAEASAVGGDLEHEADLYLAAIAIPNSSVALEARVNLGKNYLRQKQYQRAIPYLHEAILLPRSWSETTNLNEAHIYLSAANFLLENASEFRKHKLAAETSSKTSQEREALEYWFDYWDLD